MAKRKYDTTSKNPLATNEASNTWQHSAYDVLAMIPRFIQTMGLPAPIDAERRESACALGGLPRKGDVRRALMADIGLQDRIYDAVERDFHRAVAKGQVDRNQIGGWINRTTQRKTWKLATQRARQLRLEIQPFHTDRQIFDNISDFGPPADELLADEEFRACYESVIVSLSVEDCQLLDAKAEGNGYSELAAIRGKTSGALKAEACRLCARIRRQVMGIDDGSRKVNSEAAE